MGLEDLTGSNKYIDDLDDTNPDGSKDTLDEGDDHLRGVKNVLKNTFTNITGAIQATQVWINTICNIQSPDVKGSNYTVVQDDHGKTIQVNSGATITLEDAATLGAGWRVTLVNTESSTDSTIDTKTSGDKIDGGNSITLLAGGSVSVVVNSAEDEFLTLNDNFSERFPNVNGDVTATDAELNQLDGNSFSDGATFGSPTGGDQGSGTVNAEALYEGGNRVVTVPGGSNGPNIGFNNWRTPSNTAPTYITANATAYTDGNDDGVISFEVDESGGTTRDYYIDIAFSTQDNSSGTYSRGGASILIPPGASYKIENVDPTGNNLLLNVRETVLA